MYFKKSNIHANKVGSQPLEDNMNFNELDLLRAQKEGIISIETFNRLLEFLTASVKNNKIQDSSVMETLPNNKPSKFNIENFLYYFGAFIIISTMGWYLGSVWDNFGHN